MKKVSLFICVFAVIIIDISCNKSSSVKYTTVNVSGLFSLTGNWSGLGLNSKAALEIAADDINEYLADKKAAFRMYPVIYDTKLNPDSAKLAFVNTASNGIHFIIGPQSSSELASIVPLVQAGQMIVVSQSSTAGSLAIAGDPVYRFCPPDKVEGAAMANTIYNAGKRALVTVARNDTGNLGLQSATGAAFIAKGGAISAISYSTTITSVAPLIAEIKDEVSILAATYGIENTAVYLASFDEGVDLFAMAVNDSLLGSVKWYGGDGMVLSAMLPAIAAASEFAIKTSYFAPSFGLPTSLQSKWQPVADRIKAKTGFDADAFALAAYDAMWVIAHTLEATKGVIGDMDVLKTTFVQQSNAYSGVTGSTTLDSMGDRASGSFDYWGIAHDGSAYKWIFTGTSD